MNYRGMHRSNVVSIDPDKRDLVRSLKQNYALDGCMRVTVDDTVWFESANSDFGVWNEDGLPRHEEFLARLSDCLAAGETLCIRSVGFTGTREIPDAYQHRVSADGEITLGEHLPDPTSTIPVDG